MNKYRDTNFKTYIPLWKQKHFFKQENHKFYLHIKQDHTFKQNKHKTSNKYKHILKTKYVFKNF